MTEVQKKIIDGLLLYQCAITGFFYLFGSGGIFANVNSQHIFLNQSYHVNSGLYKQRIADYVKYMHSICFQLHFLDTVILISFPATKILSVHGVYFKNLNIDVNV